LVIDDDPLCQIVVSEGLIAGGLKHVEVADDGVEGMEKLVNARNPIDLIAVDLQMPNMTGVDVVRELARIGFQGGVIIISSEESNLLRSVHNLAKMVGVNILGAMGKPLDVTGLHALIQKEFTEQDKQPKRVISRAQVFDALAKDEIIPYYQPKISLTDHSITGFEVLARRVTEDDKTSAPTEYLDAIEKYGLSIEFLSKMISKAAEDTRAWRKQLGSFKLAFNLTPLAVQDSGLPDRLLAIVKNAGLEPSTITFEITENHLLECTAASLEVLSLMRLYGFALSIDDFGTGATSIEQLRTFPFTELKIDGRFMMASGDDEFSRLTVQTSAKLAAMLGMKVVAEGVETPEAIQFAWKSGAHEVQGFHFARAMSAEHALNWITAHKRSLPCEVGAA
jgi:EAL domain-containing protein (putative c-di-GMP-specific phosphodiesterase class I)